MIVVRVEMWPKGDKARAVEFARAYIINQATTTQASGGALGDYRMELHGGVYSKPLRAWKCVKVVGFNRRARGAWDLLYLALRNAIGARNA
jgi:hypothetical protein